MYKLVGPGANATQGRQPHSFVRMILFTFGTERQGIRISRSQSILRNYPFYRALNCESEKLGDYLANYTVLLVDLLGLDRNTCC